MAELALALPDVEEEDRLFVAHVRLLEQVEGAGVVVEVVIARSVAVELARRLFVVGGLGAARDEKESQTGEQRRA